jgi:hypothetical protein
MFIKKKERETSINNANFISFKINRFYTLHQLFQIEIAKAAQESGKSAGGFICDI